MATKLAMTCLSHMVLSPVGLWQIGNECQHMASAALRLRVSQGSVAFTISSMSCNILPLLFALPHFPTVSFVKLFFCFLRPFVSSLCPPSFSSSFLYPNSSSCSDTANNLNNNLSTVTTQQRQVEMTTIFFFTQYKQKDC